MFAIGIRYLNDWAMATHPSFRDSAEWPPHPDRVFMALAAAHFETGEDADERAALEWLEAQNAPALNASPSCERGSVVSYVPVNDTEIACGKDNPLKLQKWLERVRGLDTLKAAKNAGLALLPEFRSRQPRCFPVAVPYDPFVYLIWNGTPNDLQRSTLARLCEKVTYVGHSASLVQCWVEPKPPAAKLVPSEQSARHRLRIAGVGRLAQLQNAFKANRRPNPSLWSGYDIPPLGAPREENGYVFSRDVLIFRRVEGPSLPLESTLTLTKTLRDAFLSLCPQQPPPEWFSGHRPDKTFSETPHLAFFPLPFVGSEHADGHILGLGIAVPRGIDRSEQGKCFRNVVFDDCGRAKTLDLKMGRVGVWKIELEERESPAQALRGGTWSPAEPSARWATVTPIVFDRHPNLSADEKARMSEGATSPDQLRAREQTALAQYAERVVKAACEFVGLPAPEVVLSPVSMFPGTPHARSFPCVQRKSGGNLHHTHAILLFPKPVYGPVLLGAGRYKGYGLCRPLI
jgi:CRISPR-associated protein Csb2